MATRAKSIEAIYRDLNSGPGIVPDDLSDVPAISRPPQADKPKGKVVVQKLDLTDSRIEARRDFAEGRTILLHDHGGTQSVPGLRLRIGPRSATWLFYRDVLDHGRRQITSKTLGGFPEVTTADARKAAHVIAGRLSGGAFEPSRGKARKFADAFIDYLDYLQTKADDAGKPARWRYNVKKLGDALLLPRWGNWPMLDLSKHRGDAVADWYKRVVKDHGVTSANHAMRIIRAIYIREANRDDSLPGDPTKLPSAAVTMRRENWQKQKHTDKPGLALRDFPKWLKAWRELLPVRRAYALTGLLTGARPGELSRTPWTNLDTKSRTLTIGNSKTGGDIPIPLSAPIVRALKLARANADKSGLIFPGCEQAGHRDALPARGHALRRTYKTVATDCGVSDELSAFLLGHIPEGMSAKYALRRMLLDGPMLRRKQREISARVLALLGSDPTR
jgi:integrase